MFTVKFTSVLHRFTILQLAKQAEQTVAQGAPKTAQNRGVISNPSQLQSCLAASFFLESGSLTVKVVSFASRIDEPETIVLNAESEDQIEGDTQLPILSEWSDRFSVGHTCALQSRDLLSFTSNSNRKNNPGTLKQSRALLGQ